jgi:hypothetical protein
MQRTQFPSGDIDYRPHANMPPITQSPNAPSMHPQCDSLGSARLTTSRPSNTRSQGGMITGKQGPRSESIENSVSRDEHVSMYNDEERAEYLELDDAFQNAIEHERLLALENTAQQRQEPMTRGAAQSHRPQGETRLGLGTVERNEAKGTVSARNDLPATRTQKQALLDADARRRGYESSASRDAFLHSLVGHQLPNYFNLEQASEDRRTFRKIEAVPQSLPAMVRRHEFLAKRGESTADTFPEAEPDLELFYDCVRAYQEAKRQEWVLNEYERMRRGADTGLYEEDISQARHKMELEDDIAHLRASRDEHISSEERHAMIRDMRDMGEEWGLTQDDMERYLASRVLSLVSGGHRQEGWILRMRTCTDEEVIRSRS